MERPKQETKNSAKNWIFLYCLDTFLMILFFGDGRWMCDAKANIEFRWNFRNRNCDKHSNNNKNHPAFSAVKCDSFSSLLSDSYPSKATEWKVRIKFTFISVLYPSLKWHQLILHGEVRAFWAMKTRIITSNQLRTWTTLKAQLNLVPAVWR